jgi:bacteriorhodopsin
MDPAVRSLARTVVARSWLIKILLVADFMTLVCFLMANLGRGTVVATWYGFGVLGILIAVLGSGVAGWALRK